MYKDTRLGGVEKWYHTAPEDAYMRIPDDITKAVCFVCLKLPTGDGGFKMHSIGTAFFVSVPVDEECDFRYLITAKHLLDEAKRVNQDNLYLRVNTKLGKYKHVSVSLKDFIVWSNKAIDIAISLLQFSWEDLDQKVFSVESFALNEVIKKEWIGLGEDVFATGLFVNRTGKKRNIPIVRSGIISAMPDEPIPYKGLGEFDAFLVELRSIGGLSGSPVFVHLKPDRPVPTSREDIYFLGVIRGHWELAKEEEDLQDDVRVGFSKGENLNVGIAIVTTAETVFQLLYSKELIQMREKYKKKYDEKQTGFVEDSVFDKENTFTETVFQDALKKASQKTSEPDSEKKETSE